MHMLLVRDKELPCAERELLAFECVKRGHENGCPVLISDDEKLAQLAGADGVQFSSAKLGNLEALRRRPRIVGASVHNLTEARLASASGKADFVVLSPVHKTATHPDAPALGWEKFELIAAQTGIPVYALGGLTAADVPLAIHHGAQGVAAMRSVWALPRSRARS